MCLTVSPNWAWDTATLKNTHIFGRMSAYNNCTTKVEVVRWWEVGNLTSIACLMFLLTSVFSIFYVSFVLRLLCFDRLYTFSIFEFIVDTLLPKICIFNLTIIALTDSSKSQLETQLQHPINKKKMSNQRKPHLPSPSPSPSPSLRGV